MVSAAQMAAAPAPGMKGPWPVLREDLRLHHGPALPDGQPSWTLQDPVRHRFVRIDWVTYEVLRCWWLGDADRIAEQVNAQSTLAIAREHVLAVLAFARRHELVEPAQAMAGDRDQDAGLGTIARWLLHHYLFFRVPLFNPDAALRRWLPAVERLGARWFLRATLAALLLAMVFVARDWDAFRAQAVDLLSWRGLVLYGITLVSVKVAHEFGHAFVARRHGCRVPTMGIAFMVLWPVAYTDTSEAWRLADRQPRLQIALAGVRTEMTIAAWALLAWALLPDGPLRTAAFILGTLTWITTLAINLSPFMRFDGYFVLCDALDQPNLHERSFAMARWWLRRLLLGWEAAPPEEMSAPARRAMIGFALATWAYRFVLYLGIAWLVYHFAFKALGLLLFAVEIWWFIALPLWREAAAWAQGRAQWRGSTRARRWRWLAPLAVLLGFVPLPAYEGAGAMLQPAQHLALRLPAAAVIERVHVRAGDAVAAGAPLVDASSPLLQQRLDALQGRIRQLQSQVAAASVDSLQQSQWNSLQEQLATVRDEDKAVRDELARFHPRAPFAGQVLEVDPGLRSGMVASPRQVLVQLAAPGAWRVVAYASEEAARVTRPDDATRFVADADPRASWDAVVVSVSPNPATVLAEPMLARAHGGAVDTVNEAGHQLPREAVYRVELELTHSPALGLRQWRGHVRLAQPWRSVWQRVWTALAGVLTRELGF